MLLHLTVLFPIHKILISGLALNSHLRRLILMQGRPFHFCSLSLSSVCAFSFYIYIYLYGKLFTYLQLILLQSRLSQSLTSS